MTFYGISERRARGDRARGSRPVHRSPADRTRPTRRAVRRRAPRCSRDYLRQNGVEGELCGESARPSEPGRAPQRPPGRRHAADDGSHGRRARRRRRVVGAALRRHGRRRLRVGLRRRRHEEPARRRGCRSGSPRPFRAPTLPARSSSRPPSTRSSASTAACAGSAGIAPSSCAATISSMKAWADCGCRSAARRSSFSPSARRPSCSFACAPTAAADMPPCPSTTHSAVIDLARAVAAIGDCRPPATIDELTKSPSSIAIVADGELRSRLKDPARAHAAVGELRALRAGRRRSRRAASGHHVHTDHPRAGPPST